MSMFRLTKTQLTNNHVNQHSNFAEEAIADCSFQVLAST